MVDPDQDHQIAIKVKTSFIKDTDSTWMTKYPQNAPALIQQIQQHQYFAMLQQQQMMLQQQMQMLAGGGQNPGPSFQNPMVSPAAGPANQAQSIQQQGSVS